MHTDVYMNVYSHNAITTIKNNSFVKLVNIFTLSLKGNESGKNRGSRIQWTHEFEESFSD